MLLPEGYGRLGVPEVCEFEEIKKFDEAGKLRSDDSGTLRSERQVSKLGNLFDEIS